MSPVSLSLNEANNVVESYWIKWNFYQMMALHEKSDDLVAIHPEGGHKCLCPIFMAIHVIVVKIFH